MGALRFCHAKGLKTKIFSNGYKSDIIEEINNQGLCDAWSIDFKGLNNIQEQFGVPASSYLINVDYSINDIARRGLPLEIRTTFYIGNEEWKDEIKLYVKEKYLDRYKNITYIEQEDVRGLL